MKWDPHQFCLVNRPHGTGKRSNKISTSSRKVKKFQKRSCVFRETTLRRFMDPHKEPCQPLRFDRRGGRFLNQTSYFY